MVLLAPNREAKPKRAPAGQHAGEENALRAATLAAIAEMTLEDLGKLRVPMEHIYRHFAPK